MNCSFLQTLAAATRRHWPVSNVSLSSPAKHTATQPVSQSERAMTSSDHHASQSERAMTSSDHHASQSEQAMTSSGLLCRPHHPCCCRPLLTLHIRTRIPTANRFFCCTTNFRRTLAINPSFFRPPRAQLCRPILRRMGSTLEASPQQILANSAPQGGG